MPTPSENPDSLRAIIQQRAVELLRSSASGMRFMEIKTHLAKDMPDVAPGTIAGALVALSNQLPDEILKPSRGYYIHAKYGEPSGKVGGEKKSGPPSKTREVAFYQPFADYLITELEECTRAIPLGGSKFGGKWGTPDVIGVREQPRGSLVAFPTEIVSAEIKTETSQLIVAFGQAVAYRLFSHKSYLVVPMSSSEEDVGRLDVLSRIVGIGLILFDSAAPADPRFSIRVRAMKHEPDGFYLNECVRTWRRTCSGRRDPSRCKSRTPRQKALPHVTGDTYHSTAIRTLKRRPPEWARCRFARQRLGLPPRRKLWERARQERRNTLFGSWGSLTIWLRTGGHQ